MAKNSGNDVDMGSGSGLGLRLSTHPRARRDIAVAKGWGGIAGFAIVAVLSHRAGAPLGSLLLRSTLAGIGASLFCGGLAVLIWRQLALAQIEGLRRQLVNEIGEREERLAAERDRKQLEAQALGEAAHARQRAPEGALER